MDDKYDGLREDKTDQWIWIAGDWTQNEMYV